MAKARSFISSSKTLTCHLCRIPIPEEIVDARHPLYGTIDHIVPLGAGGFDVLTNRAPAHRLCNQAKGSRMLDTVFERDEFADLVAPEVERCLVTYMYGQHARVSATSAGRNWLEARVKRNKAREVGRAKRIRRKVRDLLPIYIWEGEGGTVI